MSTHTPKLSLRYFSVTDITLPKYQPRLTIEHSELVELADSIKHAGLIQPLYVYLDNGVPVLVAGERRWRAAQLASMEQVPCIVSSKKLTEKERFILAVSENLHRVDLDLWETAQSLAVYQQQFDLSLNDIVHLHKGTVSKWSRILKINKATGALKEAVKNKLIQSVVVIGYLIDVYKLDSAYGDTALQTVLDGSYNGTAEQYVKECKDRVKAADYLGYLPPEPDASGRYDSSHPNVVFTKWTHKTISHLTISALQVAKDKWVGGYALQLGQNNMSVPLSLSFVGTSHEDLKANIAQQLITYVDGLISRSRDPKLRIEIDKLRCYLLKVAAEKAVSEQQYSRGQSKGTQAMKVPDSMKKDKDHLIIEVGKESIVLDIKAIQALL